LEFSVMGKSGKDSPAKIIMLFTVPVVYDCI
jgi:hypothetical protein